MYRVFKEPKFQKKVEKLLDKHEIKELEKFITNLKKGILAGKGLTYNFFREKKIGGKRIYFLVYDDIKVILLVGCSNKKYQQTAIDEIKLFFPELKKYAYDIFKQ